MKEVGLILQGRLTSLHGLWVFVAQHTQRLGVAVQGRKVEAMAAGVCALEMIHPENRFPSVKKPHFLECKFNTFIPCNP